MPCSAAQGGVDFDDDTRERQLVVVASVIGIPANKKEISIPH
jgi:hypothetical protein